jgi:hypothetical protein
VLGKQNRAKTTAIHGNPQERPSRKVSGFWPAIWFRMSSLAMGFDTELTQPSYATLRTSGTTLGLEGSAARAVTYSETRVIAASRSPALTIL